MNEPLKLHNLEEATDRFFQMHWNITAIGKLAPNWIGWHEFNGSVPNYQHAGCYALFQDTELLYIGVGASKGGGLYPDHGISRRLMSHVLRIDRQKGPTWSKPRTGWESITSIYTIGFESKQAYLSLALESFLIREFFASLKNSRV